MCYGTHESTFRACVTLVLLWYVVPGTCTRVSKFKFLKKQNFIHKLKVDVDP